MSKKTLGKKEICCVSKNNTRQRKKTPPTPPLPPSSLPPILSRVRSAPPLLPPAAGPSPSPPCPAPPRIRPRCPSPARAQRGWAPPVAGAVPAHRCCKLSVCTPKNMSWIFRDVQRSRILRSPRAYSKPVSSSPRLRNA